LTPAQAAALRVAPSLATNVAQCRSPRLRKLVSMLWPACSTLALTVRLQASGGLTVMTTPAVVALATAFVGPWLGSVVRDRISVQAFQRSFFMVFVGLGAANVLHGH
jgi:uncharacterized membrane protein YfcA